LALTLIARMNVAPLAAAPPSSAPVVTELRYSGSLSKVGREADGEVLKRLHLVALVVPAEDQSVQVYYSVEERGGGEWAWPERFGKMSFSSDLTPSLPKRWKILSEYDGVPHIITLPSPYLVPPEPFKEGLEWMNGNETWTVTEAGTQGEEPVWLLRVSTPIGLKRKLAVSQKTSRILSLEERVFMGQGEEHLLRLNLDQSPLVSAPDAEKSLALFQSLLKIQESLNRGDDNTTPDLSAEQLKQAESAVTPELDDQATGTSFAQLVTSIRRDLKRQRQRGSDLEVITEKFVGTQAPPLQLRLVDGIPAEPHQLETAGKITLLHIWDYRGEPLREPYGQIGFLDYLYNRRKRLGVQVYGIAVNPQAEQIETRPQAERSVRKLREFMNLSYPISLHPPALLGEFGDPRRAGGKLPVWVVIGPDGKIVHYHTGEYHVMPNEGLKQLDDLLVKLVRELHAEKKEADKTSAEPKPQ
jgi:hypothetical protein